MKKTWHQIHPEVVQKPRNNNSNPVVDVLVNNAVAAAAVAVEAVAVAVAEVVYFRRLMIAPVMEYQKAKRKRGKRLVHKYKRDTNKNELMMIMMMAQ